MAKTPSISLGGHEQGAFTATQGQPGTPRFQWGLDVGTGRDTGGMDPWMADQVLAASAAVRAAVRLGRHWVSHPALES